MSSTLDMALQKKTSTLVIESNSFVSTSFANDCGESVPKIEFDIMKENLEGEITRLRIEMGKLAKKIGDNSSVTLFQTDE